MKDSCNSTMASIFWSSVDRTGECWVWYGSRDRQGYGRLQFHGKTVKAHRVAYELQFGNLPAELVVCHHCDNPRCVRPEHLFLGTRADNTLDAKLKKRLASHEKNGRAKITVAIAQEIRQRYAEEEITQQQLGFEYSLNQTTISAIIRHRNWKV